MRSDCLHSSQTVFLHPACDLWRLWSIQSLLSFSMPFGQSAEIFISSCILSLLFPLNSPVITKLSNSSQVSTILTVFFFFLRFDQVLVVQKLLWGPLHFFFCLLLSQKQIVISHFVIVTKSWITICFEREVFSVTSNLYYYVDVKQLHGR